MAQAPCRLLDEQELTSGSSELSVKLPAACGVGEPGKSDPWYP
jgi:hypothetical protein